MQPELVLSVSGSNKSFGGPRSLMDVDLILRANGILAFIDDSGAGETMLIKVLTGVYLADTGSIEVDGEPTQVRSRQDTRTAGIAAVCLDLGLVDTFPAPHNVFL